MSSTAPLPLAAVSEQDGVRRLHLGTDPATAWVQGAMRVRQPGFVELEYARRMLAGLLWLDAGSLGQGVAMHLGLGAGSLTRFTHDALGMLTAVVEINPHVIEACRRFFHVERGPRLQIIEADAGSFIKRCPSAGVRLLFVDVYDRDVSAPVFDSAEFFSDCRALLEPGGVMTMNLIGAALDLQATLGRIAAVFGAQEVWTLAPTVESHVIVVAAKGASLPALEEQRQRALAIERRFLGAGLKAGSWPRLIHPVAATA